jgi:hypothetical protein
MIKIWYFKTIKKGLDAENTHLILIYDSINFKFWVIKQRFDSKEFSITRQII